MLMVELFPLFCSSRSVAVPVVKSRDGYVVSATTLNRALRRVGVPEWATLFLRPNSPVKSITVISRRSAGR